MTDDGTPATRSRPKRAHTFLGRLTLAVQEQNWFAVVLELFIVVVGVVVGFQVTAWGNDRDLRTRERLLLGELRMELDESVRQLRIKRTAFAQVGRSGERSIAFLDAGGRCDDDCWSVLVGFFHASQWQQILVSRSTYDEMRRNGWPRDRAILAALEAYHRQAAQLAVPMDEPPAYRALVRGLIPLEAHAPYWATCFELTDGEELYLEDCPAGVDPAVSAAGVAAIVAHDDIHAALTEWAGFAAALGVTIDGLIDAAGRAITLIDAELGQAS